MSQKYVCVKVLQGIGQTAKLILHTMFPLEPLKTPLVSSEGFLEQVKEPETYCIYVFYICALKHQSSSIQRGKSTKRRQDGILCLNKSGSNVDPA